jgi:hypothetical protein
MCVCMYTHAQSRVKCTLHHASITCILCIHTHSIRKVIKNHRNEPCCLANYTIRACVRTYIQQGYAHRNDYMCVHTCINAYIPSWIRRLGNWRRITEMNLPASFTIDAYIHTPEDCCRFPHRNESMYACTHAHTGTYTRNCGRSRLIEMSLCSNAWTYTHTCIHQEAITGFLIEVSLAASHATPYLHTYITHQEATVDPLIEMSLSASHATPSLRPTAKQVCKHLCAVRETLGVEPPTDEAGIDTKVMFVCACLCVVCSLGI